MADERKDIMPRARVVVVHIADAAARPLAERRRHVVEADTEVVGHSEAAQANDERDLPHTAPRVRDVAAAFQRCL